MQEDFTTRAGEEKMRAIHSALSNKDSLQIFNLTAEGINASLEVLATHNLSKKRYYVRLKELITLGLVFKDKGVYRQTELGSLIYENQVKNLKQILFKRSNIQVLQELKKEKGEENQASEETISEVVLTELESSLGIENLKPVKVFRSWSELSNEAGLIIISANSEVYVASRYVDFRTAEAALDAAKRGCRINIIHSPRSSFSPKLQLLGNLMTHPRAISVFKELTRNNNVKMKEAEIAYSFLVADSCKVGIEIVNPLDAYSFFLGLLFESPPLAAKLISNFNSISAVGDKDSIYEKFESELKQAEKTRENASGEGSFKDSA